VEDDRPTYIDLLTFINITVIFGIVKVKKIYFIMAKHGIAIYVTFGSASDEYITIVVNDLE